MLSHINVAFRFTLVLANLSESFSKHKPYKYTNVVFTTVAHLF